MRKYETIFILDSLLKSEEIDAIVSKFERFISANGGQIDVVERWGKKRLAYEIKKRQYGYYVLIRFDGPPAMIKSLEREYRLNESVLRYKTLLMRKEAIAALANRPAPAKPQPAELPVAPAAEPAADEAAVPAEEADSAETPATPKLNEPAGKGKPAAV